MIEYEDRVIVIDSHPGAGKTQWAIQYINNDTGNKKFIYITPYKKEIERIIASCPNKDFKQPRVEDGEGSKLRHLFKLVQSGVNIVSSHALFSNIDDKLIYALQMKDYVLFLDEVFQTVDRYNMIESDLDTKIKDKITKMDVETLISQQLIKVEDDFKITWIDKNKPLSKYNNLMEMSDRGLIYFVNGSLLLWTFPIEVFEEGVFNKIFILTHRFESQLQAYYYKYFDLHYTKYMVYKENDEYKIIQGDSKDRELEWKKFILPKIHILEDDRMNRIGAIYKDFRTNRSYKSALSKTWYENKIERIEDVRNNLLNYFTNIFRGNPKEKMWTCFDDEFDAIKSHNISKKSWLACNARATNEYADKTILAYLVNRYVDPFYDDFFEHKQIKINQDEYAVSEMMQWIWRSAIRNDKDINIYIPSARMRSLLKQYLNNEVLEF